MASTWDLPALTALDLHSIALPDDNADEGINVISKYAHHIVSLFQKLHNVKFLELSLEIVEFLSSNQDLILHQPSPFVNLKSLKIYPETVWYYNAPKKVAMSTELKSYLLDSSPRATFTMVLREEIKAQKLMADLRVHLEKKMINPRPKELA
ncbi:hypothetical protein QVD17_04110 [Tagetes erecta]|uniref:Uncharacterized protein n=1 Tax=Tagetes erecta TaxID=13708 RepID=A0AAD8P9H2_TARER|nr:hypothetical protein QVD17_04110 [Tagetes erecta]